MQCSRPRSPYGQRRAGRRRDRRVTSRTSAAPRRAPSAASVSVRGSSTASVARRSPRSPLAPSFGRPWPRSRNTWPAGVPARDLDAHRPLERRHLRLAAEDGGGQGHPQGGLEVVALALERRVGRDPHAQVEVASPPAGAAPALARHPHARAVAHARRDLHLDPPAACRPTRHLARRPPDTSASVSSTSPSASEAAG